MIGLFLIHGGHAGEGLGEFILCGGELENGADGGEEDAAAEASVREKVSRLVGRFPIYEG